MPSTSQPHPPHPTALRPPAALAFALALALACCSPGEEKAGADSDPQRDTQAQQQEPTAEPGPAPAPSPGDGGQTSPAAEPNPEPPAAATAAQPPVFDPDQQAEDRPYPTNHWPHPESAAVSPAVNAFLALPDDAARVAEIRRLAAAQHPDLAAVLRRALQDGSPEVVAASLGSAGSLAAKDAADILSAAAANTLLPELADSAFETARSHSPEVLLEVLENAFVAHSPEVRVRAVEEFAAARDKYYIDRMFPVLDDPNPVVQAAAAGALNNLFGREFLSNTDAQRWWGQHSHEYDPQLRPNPPTPAPAE